MTQHPEVRLVLVNGAQRSGTTMLASLLGSAEDAFVLPDSGLLAAVARAARGVPGAMLPGPTFDGIIRSLPRLRRWPVPYDRLVAHDAPSRASAHDHLVGFATHVAELQGQSPPRTVISHEPTDVFELHAIAATFNPPALVNLLRDGRAVARSLTRVSWGPASLIDAARTWERQVGYGRVAMQHFQAIGLPATECRYESLVSNPDLVLREVCEDVALTYTPDMALAGSFRPLPFSQADHALVGEAPSPGRSDAWTSELSTDDIAVVEGAVGGMLALVGYELVTDQRVSAGRRAHERFRSTVSTPARHIRHRLTRNPWVTGWR